MLLAGSADPFGLWESPRGAEAESFTLPGEGPAEEGRGQGLVWTLDLRTGAGAGWGVLLGEETLAQREREVQAITSGLNKAAGQAQRVLARHQAARGGALVSFDIGSSVAELDLAAALVEIDHGEGAESFALDLPKVDWPVLKRQFETFWEAVNRQVLHYAWVETRLEGALTARTAVRWGGDLTTTLRAGIAPQIAQTHARSMTLALNSRAANIRAALVVVRIAAKIALAVSSPIGAAQALSLAWQFVYGIIVPLLEEARQKPV